MTTFFDAETHAYVDVETGAELVSVTRVIRAERLRLGERDPWFKPEHSARGRAVHAWTAALDTGAPLPDLDPAFTGYTLGWSQWTAMTKPVWTHVEHVVARPVLGIAGTLDRLGFIAGRPTLVDLKTGSPSKWHAVQLAGYDALLHDGVERQRLLVYVTKDGRCRVVAVPYGDADARWAQLAARAAETERYTWLT